MEVGFDGCILEDFGPLLVVRVPWGPRIGSHCYVVLNLGLNLERRFQTCIARSTLQAVNNSPPRHPQLKFFGMFADNQCVDFFVSSSCSIVFSICSFARHVGIDRSARASCGRVGVAWMLL